MTTMDEQPMTGLINSPTSQFTAVNVKEPQNGYHAFNGIHLNGALKKASDDWNHGQSRVTPPGHEKLTISTSTPKKDAWGPPPPSEQRPPHPAPSAYNEADPTHKRKRSKSAEDSPAPNSFHVHPLPSKETPIASTESDGPRDDEPKNQPVPRNHYQADVPYRHFSSATEQTSAGESWSADSGPRPGHATSEEQLKEALQKASSTMDSQRDPHNQQDFNENSPEDDDQPMGPYPAYPIEGREGVYLRCDPRKRKRNFSNRTKTGCMTCRKRKKKCDEARPECNNCSRGGFVCAGYQAARGYPKTEQKQAPVLLQSKYEGGSKYEPGYSPQPWPQMGQQSRREPLPGYRGQQLRVDPQHGRPNGYEEEPPAASTSPEMMSGHSPEHNRLSTTGFNQQTPTPISANTNSPYDRGQKLQYERMGPLHDPAREIPTPQSGAHMFHPQMQSDGPHGNNVQVAAQLALSNLASTNRQRTQKEEMLVGKPFLPFDKELTLERERCKIACRTFNTNTGVSSEERIRLFREILQPRDMAVSPTHASPVTQVGQLGKNVIVEESFKCTYGYNISIGQDVLIDHDVTIHDSCEVKIGDRCTIGAHVKIITESLYTDPQRRLGNRGQHFARSVTIGVDCWIGVGVIIHPGVKIGDGVTIVAGSVVDKDIPRYTIAAGNPAQVTGGAVGGANVHE